MFSIAIELGGRRSLRYYKPLSVDAGLRGYAERDNSQLQMPGSRSGSLVSITGLATRCPTARDLFLEKRVKVDTPSWERQVLGRVVDAALVELHRKGLDLMEDYFEANAGVRRRPDLSELQRQVTSEGVNIAGRVLNDWVYSGRDKTLKDLSIDEFADHLRGAGKGSDLVEKTHAALMDLMKYEAGRLISYLRGRARVGKGWMAEARATIARLQTGLKLDVGEASRLFGIQPNVCPDFVYAVTLVGDVKTGEFHSFYETVAKGYTIFAEYMLKRRINTAAILAVDLDLERGCLRSHKVHMITPDGRNRQRWMTQRDVALSVIRGESAPSHPVELRTCMQCPYREHCWEGGVPGERPTTPLLPGGVAAT